jgi:beta-N-acetylhexosaminidase
MVDLRCLARCPLWRTACLTAALGASLLAAPTAGGSGVSRSRVAGASAAEARHVPIDDSLRSREANSDAPGASASGGWVPASAAAAASTSTSAPPTVRTLDKAAARWVQSTLARMTIDEKIGQMIVPAFQSTYLSSDSDEFDRLSKLVRDVQVGGFIMFGGTEPAPNVLLNPTYGTVILGQPLAAASTLNRLQDLAKWPLLNAADFESGAGFRLAGATAFPREMAFGAANDERLTLEAGRIAAQESRALGIHVDFAPVVDVNNNPRNPVINTRSFGEDPARVGALAAAYVRGLVSGGAIATLKHFPGHGDTAVDTHLGLATIPYSRERLAQIELPPFKAAIAAGADAVMVAHIALPAIDPSPGTPATLSQPIVSGLLRHDLGFNGLVYTDSMEMQGVAQKFSAGDAAVRAVQAGNDFVLHSPDERAAAAALKKAVASGAIAAARIDESVTRILQAKARLGLYRERRVNLEAVPTVVGTRAHAAVADEISRKSMTLIKDDRQQVPLTLPRDAQVLYLSVLDYPSGWRIAAPSRTFLPELRKRWPNVTAVELSDRSTQNEIDLLRAMTPRFDGIVVSVFVRAASASGRMDLAAPLVQVLRDVAASSGTRKQPFVTVLFGNPYVAMALSDLPALLLTYDFYDRAETSAVRAIAGDAPIGGHLPIALPGLFPLGHGLDRAAKTKLAETAPAASREARPR